MARGAEAFPSFMAIALAVLLLFRISGKRYALLDLFHHVVVRCYLIFGLFMHLTDRRNVRDGSGTTGWYPLSFIYLYCNERGHRFNRFLLSKKTWCVAKSSSDEATLWENLNYACSQVDCSVLREGSSCFHPDNLMSHASVAMNLYYQAAGRNKWNCCFKNSALVATTDPSKILTRVEFNQ